MGDRIQKFSDLREKRRWDVEGMSQEDLAASFAVTDEKMNIIYKFVLGYSDYVNRRHTYTSKIDLTMLEVHLLTDICDEEGQTVTKLAKKWNRSVSATSQSVTQLIKKGLVERVNSAENRKVFYLVPTSEGRVVSDEHKRYDVLDTIKTVRSLMKTMDYETIEEAFRVLDRYNELLQKTPQ